MLEQMGFRVRRAPLLDAGRHRWWSAAAPTEIAGEFNALLRDPEVRAVIAHDGGQTALGHLDLIDFEAIVADPKPILGYSGISLLHLVLYARTGLVGFHADVATCGLGGSWQSAPAARGAELEKLYSTLLTGGEAVGALPATPLWECWRAGCAEGRLIGGVINRIALVQATSFALPLECFDGAVLFWEEVFLDELSRPRATVKAAAGAAGITTVAVYQRRRRDPAFAQAMDRAREDARGD